MKSALLSIFLCTAFTGSIALADETAKNAKVEELFRLTNMEQMQVQILDQVRGMLHGQMSGASASSEAKVFDLIAEAMRWDKMKPSYIQLYAETYTEDELDGILAFYRSPAGKAMLDKMPALMTRTIQMAQRRMAEMGPQIEKIVEESMKESAPAPKKK